ncbi:MAG: N-6 DNA methylase [Bacteroidales bacterium]|nr:N-6 DNA methylase [Bacteroidales bacterium]
MSTYVSLLEAATFLDVSKATLRNWDNDGKLSAVRNPVNGYRMYDLDELVRLRETLGVTKEYSRKQKDKSADTVNRTVRKMISRLGSVIRDSDANSDIVTRFDEISKVLFLKLYAYRGDGELLNRRIGEDDFSYKDRLQREYSSALERLGIRVPDRFSVINLGADTLIACGQEFSRVDMSSADCDIRGMAYEDLIKGTFDRNDNQQFFTPYQIVDFMVGMLRDDLKGRVCDPACGTAGFLTGVTKEFPEAEILGLEVDERLSWVSALNLAIHNCMNFDVRCLGNGGSLGPEAREFFDTVDAILTNPPFGSDYTDPDILDGFVLGRGRQSRRRGILFIEQAWNLLTDGGVVAIILDQSVLNSNSCADVRKFILDRFELMAVVDLPDTAFMPYASVNSSVLVMRKVSAHSGRGHVFFAKSDCIGRKPNGDDDIVYGPAGEATLCSDLGEILEQWKRFRADEPLTSEKCFADDLCIDLASDPSVRLDYAYHHPFRKESNEKLARTKYRLCTLAELCTERNESYIPLADQDAASILFTGLASIESNSGGVAQVPTPAASIKSAVKRYEEGDILFSKMRPNLRKVAVVRFPEGGYASGECSVLTVRKDVSGQPLIMPELLAAILRSDFVYGQIISCVTGIGRPRIGSKDLRQIKIPIPPREIQDKAYQSMRTAQSSVSRLRDRAATLNEEAKKLEQTSMNEIAQIMMGDIA